jgi:hypothetical protein
MEAIDRSWRKSSYSGNGGGNCVEVADSAQHVVAVRDSNDPDGLILAVGPAGWRGFIAEVKASRHDLG